MNKEKKEDTGIPMFTDEYRDLPIEPIHPAAFTPGGPKYPRDQVPTVAPSFLTTADVGWLFDTKLPDPPLTHDQIVSRIRSKMPHLTDEEFNKMPSFDLHNYSGDGEPMQESYEKVDGVWVQVRPGYNADGTFKELPWWMTYNPLLPPGFGPRHDRCAIPSVLSMYLAAPFVPLPGAGDVPLDELVKSEDFQKAIQQPMALGIANYDAAMSYAHGLPDAGYAPAPCLDSLNVPAPEKSIGALAADHLAKAAEAYGVPNDIVEKVHSAEMKMVQASADAFAARHAQISGIYNSLSVRLRETFSNAARIFLIANMVGHGYGKRARGGSMRKKRRGYYTAIFPVYRSPLTFKK